MSYKNLIFKHERIITGDSVLPSHFCPFNYNLFKVGIANFGSLSLLYIVTSNFVYGDFSF
jgi:hypothetical protein